MQKWEYRATAITHTPAGSQMMNELGEEGWEIVAVVRHREVVDPHDPGVTTGSTTTTSNAR